MSLAGYGNITDASEFLPGASIDIESPGVVVMIGPIRATESKIWTSASFRATLTERRQCHYVALLRRDRSGKFWAKRGRTCTRYHSVPP